MKKRITVALLVLSVILSSLSLSSCGKATSKNPQRPNDIPESNTSEYDLDSDVYTTVGETDNVKFEFNEKTTDIRITNKKTGYSWSTESTTDGTVYRGEVFSLNYYNVNGTMKNMSSSDDSVAKGQFRYNIEDNKVTVQYGIGDVNFVIDFPMAISKERKDAFYNKMNDDQKMSFDNNYSLIDFSEDKWKDDSEDAQQQLKEAQKNYPLATNGKPWYYMTNDISDELVKELHDLWYDQAVGYTANDLKKDSEGVESSKVSRPEFNVEIDYTLEGDNVRVDIPEDKIYYSTDYTVEDIQLHPGLLDFDSTTNGYYLLPDGSGSIMNFSNGNDTIRNDPVYIQMYGVDESRGVESKAAYYNNAVFPVYGCTIRNKTNAGDPAQIVVNAMDDLTNDKDTSKYNGLFATIESGESFVGIEAHSATEGDHNRLYTDFRINECQKMDSFSESSSSDNSEKFSKYQFQRYLGKLSMVYHVLSGDDATYSGMAKYYRTQLFGDQKSEKKDYYSTVENIGTINGYAYFMGIQYNKKIAMTSFDQTAKIAEDLKSNGFNNMNIRLTGWCNGGYEHGFLNKIKIQKELGGADSFKNLKSSLEKNGIGFYPDIDYQSAYLSETSVKRADRCGTLNGGTTVITDMFNPITFNKWDTLARAPLTATAMEKNLNNFVSDYTQYGIKNISLRSVGSKITANYREQDFCERQETLEKMVKQVSGLKDKQYSLMGSYGDAPFVKYLDYINNIPLTSADYDKTDYSVPFVGIVLSGHVQYTGGVINLSNSDRSDLLEMIESGAGAYYSLTANGYEDIAESDYEHFYSTKYNDIKDSVLSTYKYLSTALNDVYGYEITKHTILASGVNMVTYENGTSIVVNYNDSDYSASGINCKAKDYAVIKGA